MKILDNALDIVECSYKDIKDIAEDMLNPFFVNVDNIVKSLGNNINNLSIDTIRNVILELSFATYKLAEVRDKSSIKSQIAEAIKKEKYAIKHNETNGTVAAKDNTALVEISPEIAVETLYDLVAALSKSKVDEIHRIVDALKTVLMSRMQELRINTEVLS